MGFGRLSNTQDVKLHIPKAVLKRLTSFTIQCNWAGTQILDAVQHCVNVEYLTIDFGMDYKGWPEDDPRIEELLLVGLHLPRLRTLCVKSGRGPAAKLFDFLNAPSLVKLEINGGDPGFIRAIAMPLRTCIHDRSQCENTFHHLSIEGTSIQFYEDFRMLLQALPSIRHLACRDVFFTGLQEQYQDVLGTLTGPDLLPRLETLKLLNTICDYVNLEYLSIFRRTRWLAADKRNEVDTLKAVTITYRDNQDPVSRCYRLKTENENWRKATGTTVDIEFNYPVSGRKRRQW